jgi:hypothetical protein
MTAAIHPHPAAPRMSLPFRAELVLAMAVDAASAAADATAQVPDRLRAELLAAVERGDWNAVMLCAVRLGNHMGARSA